MIHAQKSKQTTKRLSMHTPPPDDSIDSADRRSILRSRADRLSESHTMPLPSRDVDRRVSFAQEVTLHQFNVVKLGYKRRKTISEGEIKAPGWSNSDSDSGTNASSHPSSDVPESSQIIDYSSGEDNDRENNNAHSADDQTMTMELTAPLVRNHTPALATQASSPGRVDEADEEVTMDLTINKLLSSVKLVSNHLKTKNYGNELAPVELTDALPYIPPPPHLLSPLRRPQLLMERQLLSPRRLSPRLDSALNSLLTPRTKSNLPIPKSLSDTQGENTQLSHEDSVLQADGDFSKMALTEIASEKVGRVSDWDEDDKAMEFTQLKSITKIEPDAPETQEQAIELTQVESTNLMDANVNESDVGKSRKRQHSPIRDSRPSLEDSMEMTMTQVGSKQVVTSVSTQSPCRKPLSDVIAASHGRMGQLLGQDRAIPKSMSVAQLTSRLPSSPSVVEAKQSTFSFSDVAANATPPYNLDTKEGAQDSDEEVLMTLTGGIQAESTGRFPTVETPILLAPISSKSEESETPETRDTVQAENVKEPEESELEAKTRIYCQAVDLVGSQQYSPVAPSTPENKSSAYRRDSVEESNEYSTTPRDAALVDMELRALELYYTQPQPFYPNDSHLDTVMEVTETSEGDTGPRNGTPDLARVLEEEDEDVKESSSNPATTSGKQAGIGDGTGTRFAGLATPRGKSQTDLALSDSPGQSRRSPFLSGPNTHLTPSKIQESPKPTPSKARKTSSTPDRERETLKTPARQVSRFPQSGPIHLPGRLPPQVFSKSSAIPSETPQASAKNLEPHQTETSTPTVATTSKTSRRYYEERITKTVPLMDSPKILERPSSAPVDSVSLEAFLEDIGVAFYDGEFSILEAMSRDNTVNNTLNTGPELSTSGAECVNAVPELAIFETYQLCCDELGRNLGEGRKIYKDFAHAIAQNNPEVMSTYYRKEEEDRLRQNLEFQDIRKWAMAESMTTWAKWRVLLAQKLIDDIHTHSEVLDRDTEHLYAAIKRMEDLKRRSNESLLKKRAQIDNFRNLQRHLDGLSSTEIEHIRRELEERQNEISSIVNEMDERRAQVMQLQVDVSEGEIERRRRVQVLKSITDEHDLLKATSTEELDILAVKWGALKASSRLEVVDLKERSFSCRYDHQLLLNFTMDPVGITCLLDSENFIYPLLAHIVNDFPKFIESSGSLSEDYIQIMDLWEKFIVLMGDLRRVSMTCRVSVSVLDSTIIAEICHFNVAGRVMITCGIPIEKLVNYPHNVYLEARQIRGHFDGATFYENQLLNVTQVKRALNNETS